MGQLPRYTIQPGVSPMLGAIIGLILTLIILGWLWWAITAKLLPLIPIAEPFASIIQLLIGFLLLMVVIWAIVTILGLAGIHVPLLAGFR
jgi:hypothetical protein